MNHDPVHWMYLKTYFTLLFSYNTMFYQNAFAPSTSEHGTHQQVKGVHWAGVAQCILVIVVFLTF